MSADQSAPIVAVEAVTKRFGARTVLSQVSFDVAPGSVSAIVGPSGSGKSTLLRLMVGLDAFDGGALRVAGASLRAGPLAGQAAALALLHRRAGMVFQGWHLFPHMSAIENVCEAPIHVLGRSAADARRDALALLEEVGLAHRADALPRQLSGGEQQRCAIARALAMKPQVLFMDEPTSALDPARVTDLVELLGGLRDRGDLTMVIVTHEMSFAERLADQAVVLGEGEVVRVGPSGSVL